MDHAYRGGLVLAPVAAAVFVGLAFMSKGLITLCKIHLSSPDYISDQASAKIRDTIIRIGKDDTHVNCSIEPYKLTLYG